MWCVVDPNKVEGIFTLLIDDPFGKCSRMRIVESRIWVG